MTPVSESWLGPWLDSKFLKLLPAALVLVVEQSAYEPKFKGLNPTSEAVFFSHVRPFYEWAVSDLDP